MDDVTEKVHELDKQISSHELVCAERYAGIRESFDKGSKRMQRMEIVLYIVAAAVALGPGFIAEFLKKFMEH
jgi:predicted nucleic acid-binding Zn ribbon protein